MTIDCSMHLRRVIHGSRSQLPMSSLMRVASLAMACLAFVASSAMAASAHNASELRELILSKHRPATLRALAFTVGCHADGACVSRIGELSVLHEQGAIQGANGKRLQLVPPASGDTPEMDWSSVRGFEVHRAAKRWGTCLELSHAGVGKSGRFQRWTSVVLVPAKGASAGDIAYRFVGYWSGCDTLAEGEHVGEIMLPIVEPALPQGGFRVVWNHCSAQRCVRAEGSELMLDNGL